MQKVRLLIAVLVASLVFSNVFAQNTLVDIVSDNEEFSTLRDLIVAAGLADTLAGGEFTVFAPTNDAFAKLPEATVQLLLDDADLLTRVLTYHVVPGTVLSTDLEDGMTAATVEGGELDFAINDMGATVDGVPILGVDVTASNGVAHVIDSVLIPDVELEEVDTFSVTGDVNTAGSSTVFPLAERMVEVFGDAGYADEVIVASIGSGGGFERFCETGETDVSNASRAIRDSEIESCAEIGRLPIEFRVGTDALAVVVSSDNDFVEDVTAEELAAIFSTAETWADVRAEWADEPILRYIPGTDSGTFDYFVEEIFDEDTTPILEAANTQQSEDDNVLVAGIQSSPYAVGFFGFAYYQENEDTLRPIAIDGVSPNGTSAEDGSYPLARPLFIYSDAQIIADNPQVGSYINFLLTNVNDEIIEVGYFPASDRALNLARLNLLAAMHSTMMEME